MRARTVVSFSLLLGCGDAALPVRAERIARKPERSLTERAEDRRGAVLRIREAEVPPIVSECEEGDLQSCGVPVAVGSTRVGPAMRCYRTPDGGTRWARAECNTPLVVAWGDDAVAFTRPAGMFRIGLDDRTEWVSARTPWLALDRDGSGCIESERELFAGFAPLAALDDDVNGRIDARDAVFASLLLWADENQDRRCTPDEIAPLASAAIDAIDLAFVAALHGGLSSFEGDRAAVHTRGVRARIVDVHLAPLR